MQQKDLSDQMYRKINFRLKSKKKKICIQCFKIKLSNNPKNDKKNEISREIPKILILDMVYREICDIL